MSVLQLLSGMWVCVGSPGFDHHLYVCDDDDDDGDTDTIDKMLDL